MIDFRKYILGEATKGTVAAIVGAVLFAGIHAWLTTDLEYTVASKNAYLSSQLGDQGLAMTVDGKAVKNVSMVEFLVYNRTDRQLPEQTLAFTVDDRNGPALLSAGINPPPGLPTADVVEAVASKDPHTKLFRLKVVPKQQGSEFFDVVFVFEGDKAPPMSVTSLTGDIAMVPYRHWRDVVVALACGDIAIVGVFVLVMNMLASLAAYFAGPQDHQKGIARFKAFVEQRHAQGDVIEIKTVEELMRVYSLYTRPRKSAWSKVFAEQKFSD